MKTLAKESFLTFYGYTLPNREYVTLFAVPFKHIRGVIEIFSTLREYGLLKSFSVKRMNWIKIFSTNPKYFDFRNGNWRVNWLNLYSNPGILEDCAPIYTNIKLDEVDILILKELQKDPMQSISSIARTIGVDPKTARYHYTQHILKNNIILGYVVNWYGHVDACINHQMASIALEISDVDPSKLETLIHGLEKIPFISFVAFSEENNTLLSYTFMPSAYYMSTLFHIVHKILSPEMKYDVHTIDVASSQSFSIPYEKFSKDRWVFNKYTILESILETVEKSSKNVRMIV